MNNLICQFFSEQTACEKEDVINNIIDIYNLPLDNKDLMLLYNKSIEYKKEFEKYKRSYTSYIHFFEYILSNNKNMFVAIISALKNRNFAFSLIYYLFHMNINVINVGTCDLLKTDDK